MKRFILVLAAIMIPAAAMANIPHAGNSTTPDGVGVCPGSDYLLTVIVHDQNDNVMPNTPVRVIFSDVCDGLINWCTGQDHPVIEMNTNGSGVAVFGIDAGGCCMDGFPAPCDNDAGGIGTVVIEADPAAVVLSSYEHVASPDMHSDAGGGNPWGAGDKDVDLNDFVRFSSIFLTLCGCGDLQGGDGDVDLNDFVSFTAHFLHSCI